jgi:hypothetical protein
MTLFWRGARQPAIPECAGCIEAGGKLAGTPVAFGRGFLVTFEY